MPDISLFLLASAETSSFEWRAFLAPFHSVLLHFPIGFVTLACLLDIYYLRSRSPEVRKLSVYLMNLCAASAVVVAGLGLLRAIGGGYEQNALSSHRFWGLLVATVLVLTLLAQRQATRKTESRLAQGTYRAGLFGSLAALVITGHLGGNLTYGSGYLVKNAPKFVKSIFDKAATNKTAVLDPAADESDNIYTHKVQPIFESKCYGCHGPEKQKGNYRLDQKDVALKGGDSEETAIEPGDPMSSFLTHLILLPRDDDDVMPPEGKEPLTPEEIVDIVRWIQAGAPFPQTSLVSTN